MKILMATAYDYPHIGGLSTHVSTLKAGLEARGHEVDVLSFSNTSPMMRKLYTQGPSFVLNKVKKGRGIIWSHYARKKCLVQLLEKVKMNHYDIINAQDPMATLAVLDTDMPVVSTVHGYMSFEAISKGIINEGSPEANELQELEIKAYQGTQKIITVDQRLKNYVKKVSGIEATSVRNFIDIHNFKPDKSKKNVLRNQYGIAQEDLVLFVPRRMIQKNGVIYPTLALPAVLEKYPQAHLIYAGGGNQVTEIKKMIAEKGLENKITLLGEVPHAKVKDYYALADIVIVPSVHSAGVEEATSISALEAMGSGTPLIACAVGGLMEIVNPGVDGVLIEEKNVEQMSEAIIDFLDHPEKGMEMAKRAREKIEKEYSHLAAAEKYEEVYKLALNQREHQPV